MPPCLYASPKSTPPVPDQTGDGTFLATIASRFGKGVLTLLGYNGGQTVPTLPPLHNPGTNSAVIIGPSLGVIAAIILVGMFRHRKAAEKDFIVHDAGWQFQMKLTSPLTLDPTLAAASQDPAK